MRREVMAATARVAILRSGALRQLGATRGSLEVRTRPTGDGFTLLLLVAGELRGWLHVSRSGLHTYAPELERHEKRIEAAFDPRSRRAAPIQLERLGLARNYAARPGRARRGLAAIHRARDVLPTWIVPRATLARALFAARAPMAPKAFESLCQAIQEAPTPELRGYARSELRWRWAQEINHQLRRLGLGRVLSADPGSRGDVERVPLFQFGEAMPGWRIPHRVLLPVLAKLSSPTPEASVHALLDALGGPPDLLDWAP
jgi:hypothetical protein